MLEINDLRDLALPGRSHGFFCRLSPSVFTPFSKNKRVSATHYDCSTSWWECKSNIDTLFRMNARFSSNDPELKTNWPQKSAKNAKENEHCEF